MSHATARRDSTSFTNAEFFVQVVRLPQF